MKIISNVLKNKVIQQGSLLDHLLIGISGDINKDIKEVKRVKMNVSLVLDVSGSMTQAVKNKEYIDYVSKLEERNQKIRDFYTVNKESFPDPWKHNLIVNQGGIFFPQRILPELPIELRTEIERPKMQTKLTLAIDAAKKALDSLHDGDIISLVKFSNEAQVLLPGTVVTETLKLKINEILNNVKTEGATNLYDGWYVGAKQVAENIKEDQVNRVLILTDGEATHGYRTSEDFCPKVADILDAGISTTTIGFGDSFNEEMLEAISMAGNGNFYYAKVDEDLGDIFDVEFNDMKNTVAQNIKLTFELTDGVTLVSESPVTRKIEDNKYSLPNLKKEVVRNSLFTLKLDSSITKNLSEDKLLGNIVLQYSDSNGVSKIIKESLIFNVVSSEDYNNAKDNQEVKVQKALIEVATEQRKAMEELAKGNRDAARGMMESAMNLSASYNFTDDRLVGSTMMMRSSLQSLANNDSLDVVKKSVHYGKYKTERGETK